MFFLIGKQNNNNNHSNANNGNIQNPLPAIPKQERRRTVSFRKNIDSLEYLRRSTTPDVKEVIIIINFNKSFKNSVLSMETDQ